MSTGTYPTIGIARMGHDGDIRDCRCGFSRVGYTDWDMTSQRSSQQDNYSDKDTTYTEQDNYVNSPNTN